MDRVETAWRRSYRGRVSIVLYPHRLLSIVYQTLRLILHCSSHSCLCLACKYSTIAFVINMHEHHSITLSQAYQIATAQFIKLRAIDEIARFAAEEEALAYEGSDAGFDVKRDGSSRKAFVRAP